MSTSWYLRGLSILAGTPYNQTDLARPPSRRRDALMTAPVEIYTTQYCGYCRMAKSLLTRKNVTFKEIDVGNNPALRAEMTARSDGGTTVPQIFIGATHVGGCDDLYALEHAGGLDRLLAGEVTSS
jgi:glutaredoxin 3